jgi:hypothetical protein
MTSRVVRLSAGAGIALCLGSRLGRAVITHGGEGDGLDAVLDQRVLRLPGGDLDSLRAASRQREVELVVLILWYVLDSLGATTVVAHDQGADDSHQILQTGLGCALL